MIIDFHTHAFNDKLAEKAIPTLSQRSGLTSHTNGTLKDLLRSMDEAGIDKSVICNIATKPNQMTNVNDFAIQNNSERLIQFGSIHPDGENIEDELKRLKDNGIRGIKLHPDYQGFFADEDRMFSIYEMINKYDFVLIFHSGYDIGLGNPVHLTSDAVKNIAKRVDTKKFVFAHMGAMDQWEGLLENGYGDKFYIDTAFCVYKNMPEDMFMKVINTQSPDKILFATDTPWANQKIYVDEMKKRIKDKDLLDKIFYKNAQKLLGL